jgi:hypothetical protein
MLFKQVGIGGRILYFDIPDFRRVSPCGQCESATLSFGRIIRDYPASPAEA